MSLDFFNTFTNAEDDKLYVGPYSQNSAIYYKIVKRTFGPKLVAMEITFPQIQWLLDQDTHYIHGPFVVKTVLCATTYMWFLSISMYGATLLGIGLICSLS